MSHILARDTALRWKRRADTETYEPGRDPPRLYKTRWVIETLRHYLPPEHLTLAYRLRDYGARASGLVIVGREKVDGGGNHAERSMQARLDAARILAGYTDAVGVRLADRGRSCLRAIVEERTMRETLTACGHAPGSSRAVRRLVQLTMLAAQDYRDATLDNEEH